MCRIDHLICIDAFEKLSVFLIREAKEIVTLLAKEREERMQSAKACSPKKTNEYRVKERAAFDDIYNKQPDITDYNLGYDSKSIQYLMERIGYRFKAEASEARGIEKSDQQWKKVISLVARGRKIKRLFDTLDFTASDAAHYLMHVRKFSEQKERFVMEVLEGVRMSIGLPPEQVGNEPLFISWEFA